MIGNILQKIVDFLYAMFKALGTFLSNAFNTLMQFLKTMFKWLGDLLASLFQMLFDVLQAFFSVIYDLIRGLLYLIYMIGVLCVKLFQVLLALGKMLWQFIVGITKTMQSMFFNEIPSSGHGYSEVMGKVASVLHYFQLDIVAYILLFIIWIATGLGVIKLIPTIKGG